jgi:hypothetical protein
VVIAIAYIMLLWNWQLLVAIGIGGLSAVLANRGIRGNWQKYRFYLLQWLQQTDQKIVTAMGIGSIATLSTYLLLTILASGTHFWFLVAILLQGLGMFAIWSRLGKSTTPAKPRKSSPETTLHQKLSELSDRNAIQRLIAVRQLPQLVRQTTARSEKSSPSASVNTDSRRLATDALRLMLKQEPEPIVRKAILESLRVLSQSHSLGSGQPPVSLPKRQKQQSPVKTPQEID